MEIKNQTGLTCPLPDKSKGPVFTGLIFCRICGAEEEHVMKNESTYIDVVKSIKCLVCTDY